MGKLIPEMVVDSFCRIGENPLWHPEDALLYWIDIPPGQLMSYNPSSGECRSVYRAEKAIGGFTLQKNGAFLLFMADGTVRSLKNGKFRNVIDYIADERGSRFNDVIADPKGRVFCGTMSSDEHPGRLYRLDPDGKLTVLVEGLGTSNGMGFTPSQDGFYHTDTRRHAIYLYDYDINAGTIENPRIFVTVKGRGRPDGMTVDREGYVWSALWEGGALARFSPEGKETMRVTIPASKVTSVSFGGADYSDMYVTTAGGEAREDNGEGAGALFMARCGIKGKAEFRSEVLLREGL